MAGLGILGTGSPYLLTLAATSALAIMVAIALNVSMGLGGSVNLGVGVFYGCGAYGAALLNTKQGYSLGASLVVAVAIAVVVSLIVGPLLLRTRSLYFAISTLALNGIFVDIVASNDDLGGELGIPGITRPGPLPFFGEDGDPGSLRTMYLLICVALVAVLAVFAAIRGHRVGRTLEAIREDELLCQSLGYTTLGYRVFAFTVTAGLAAVAGVFYAFVIQYVNPGPFSFLTSSFQAFVIVAVGGAARTWGPILAGIVLVAGPSFLEFSATTNQYVYGGVLLAIVIFLPGGLAAGVDRLARGGAATTSSLRRTLARLKHTRESEGELS
ncbi:branched-chain amino acid ABC transporter permease [Nocardioides marmoriginsengisoli]|uniref:Branched-chain amino acid ABC transporter permease n=1 Tax=Nocardioides marmoriginsengisoli TaxID=661483 RepID=A0A3N0CHG7_9ACTN|nr:branched-chain amino acid ABC transporter permease [Nocardioides marmoriginsengisoli]